MPSTRFSGNSSPCRRARCEFARRGTEQQATVAAHQRHREAAEAAADVRHAHAALALRRQRGAALARREVRGVVRRPVHRRRLQRVVERVVVAQWVHVRALPEPPLLRGRDALAGVFLPSSFTTAAHRLLCRGRLAARRPAAHAAAPRSGRAAGRCALRGAVARRARCRCGRSSAARLGDGVVLPRPRRALAFRGRHVRFRGTQPGRLARPVRHTARTCRARGRRNSRATAGATRHSAWADRFDANASNNPCVF